MLNSEAKPSDDRAQRFFRVIVERVAILFWREPVTVVTTRQFDRLCQLEKREMLMRADRMGDAEFLDRELERVQLTQADLDCGKKNLTPIAQWPDEDFEGLFNSSPKVPALTELNDRPPASDAPTVR
jgi:hypothetical protein